MKAIINFVAFQLGWFSCVLGAAHGRPWVGPLAVTIVVAIHLLLMRRPGPELRLIFSAMAIGLLADSLLLASGWVAYPNGEWIPGLAPYWIVAMWALFATTLNVSMRWLRIGLHVSMIMGAIGGPLSYLAGAKLGAIQLTETVPALFALAVIWALALPLLVLISSRFDGAEQLQQPDFIHADWRATRHG